MAKFNMELPSIEDTLFSTQAQRDQANAERITKIPLNQIKNFNNHPFSVELDNDMRTLIESVKENGDQVRNAFGMISNHREAIPHFFTFHYYLLPQPNGFDARRRLF